MKNTTAKKLKYGSLSVILTVVFIALVIGLNLVISALASKINFKVDLTDKKIYSVSEETDVALRAGLGELYDSFEVTIKFLDDRDRFEENTSALYVRELAEELERQYPKNIKVEYINYRKNPEAVEEYLNETQTAVNASNIIVQNKSKIGEDGKEIKGAYRVLGIPAFYLLSDKDQNKPYAFQGELRFVSAIIQVVAGGGQVVGITEGHGETLSAELLEMFDASGFEIKIIDLAKQEIPKEVQILLISDPTADFQGYDGVDPNARTEITKLSEFMQDNHSIITIVGANTPALPNLQEYLYEYWGLNYVPFSQISDDKSCLPNDPLSVLGVYAGNPETNPHAYKLHEAVSTEGTGVRCVFKNAVELIVDKNKNEKVDVAIKTSENAERNLNGESKKGEFPLVGISAKLSYESDNSAHYKYVMLVGSSDFASKRGLSPDKANRRIMSSAIRMMSTVRNIPDIRYKTLEDSPLQLDKEKAENITIAITVIVPLIIMAIGFAVYLKRRHL